MNITIRIVLIIFLCGSIYSQKIEKPNFVNTPSVLEKYDYLHSCGLTIAKLPKLIVDDQINQAPLLYYSAKLGLGNNINAIGEFKTNFLTNHVLLGASFTQNIKDFYIEPSLGFAYWMGFANFAYYDTKVQGMMAYPAISFAKDFGKLRVALKTDLTFLITSSKKVDDIETQTNKKQIVGYSGSVLVEEPFLNNTYLSLGFKINYTKYFYPSWLAFNTSSTMLFIPEFIVGVNL